MSVGARFSAPVQTGPGARPASCTMGTGSFPGVNRGRGVTLIPHLLLVPWSWKGRAIPLLPLWAVRPLQSLSACTRVHFCAINAQNEHTLIHFLQSDTRKTNISRNSKVTPRSHRDGIYFNYIPTSTLLPPPTFKTALIACRHHVI